MSLSCGCYDDGPSVHRVKIVKARKPHKCCECFEPINVGDEYQYIFGVWDGEPSSYHTCEKCDDLRESLTALGFCMYYGELQENYDEYIREYAPAKIRASK
jgi:hypothetical protein